MTAFKDLWRHPQHNSRAQLRVKKVPPSFYDFSFPGGSFRQTVRADFPRTMNPRSR